MMLLSVALGILVIGLIIVGQKLAQKMAAQHELGGHFSCVKQT